MQSVKSLKQVFGNTYTTTFWRCVETWGREKPAVGLVTGHPHPSRWDTVFDPEAPCNHFIQSSVFAAQFSKVFETDVFDQVVTYCSRNKGGPLGAAEIVLTDDNGEDHIFSFETFSFVHNILTLGLYLRPRPVIAVT